MHAIGFTGEDSDRFHGEFLERETVERAAGRETPPSWTDRAIIVAAFFGIGRVLREQLIDRLSAIYDFQRPRFGREQLFVGLDVERSAIGLEKILDTHRAIDDFLSVVARLAHHRSAPNPATGEQHVEAANPMVAAQRGYIDDVIEPHDTRRIICDDLRLLRTKKVNTIPRKHSNIPL